MTVYWSGIAQPIGSDIDDSSAWPLKTVADLYSKGKVYTKFPFVGSVVNPSVSNNHILFKI